MYRENQNCKNNLKYCLFFSIGSTAVTVDSQRISVYMACSVNLSCSKVQVKNVLPELRPITLL